MMPAPEPTSLLAGLRARIQAALPRLSPGKVPAQAHLFRTQTAIRTALPRLGPGKVPAQAHLFIWKRLSGLTKAALSFMMQPMTLGRFIMKRRLPRAIPPFPPTRYTARSLPLSLGLSPPASLTSHGMGRSANTPHGIRGRP